MVNTGEAKGIGDQGETRLVMYVMIGRIVREEYLERIERQFVSAMIIYGLHRREREQQDRLADGHAGCGVCDSCAQGVEQETLQPVVVQSTESVRNVEPVVHRVDVFVEELVLVEKAVEEVFPSVKDETNGSRQVNVGSRHQLVDFVHITKKWTPTLRRRTASSE